LSLPTGLAVDGSGNLFIADWANARIRYVAASTGIITTVAGDGNVGYSGDGGAATSASLYCPAGVAVDSSDNLYIADDCNKRVRRVDATTGIITTVAGNGAAGYSGDGGPATSASLGGPSDVALDSSGNLFIADQPNNVIRRVDAATGIITTVAGNGTAGYSGDGGAATSATLTNPAGVAVDGSGNLFIADTSRNRIRRVDAISGVIITVAGDGNLGYSGDGGPATSASLFFPSGVAVEASGNFLIADTDNNRIRQVTGAAYVSLSPTSLSFGNQTVGTTSAAQTATLTNTGSATLTINSIGASGDFSETTECGSSVPAGGSCTISVTFTPTAAGTRTGTLTVSDNAPGSPQTVSLSGTGIGPPTLTSISPNSGAQGTAVAVTLTGTSFISGATVSINNAGVTVSNVSVVSSTQISATFTIAATATVGAANVTVTTSAGTSNAVTFTITSPAPTLTSISPNSGAQGTAVTVTLTGTNFISGATVGISNAGVAVSNVTVVSATQITATFTIASNATTGAANVTVTTSGGTSNAVTFTITAAAPTLTSISPNSGAQGTAVPVTLTGTGFISGATVSISNAGVAVSNVSVVSATQITATFTIAATATLGAANVTVTTSGGTSNAVTFTITAAAPTLTTISPNSGVQGTAVPVTLTGTNFTSGATVSISNAGVAVSNVVVVNATQITATFTIAGAAPLGAANVTVTASAGTSNAVTFTVTAPPVVALSLSGLSPTTVPTQPTGVGITLTSPASAELTGTLTLSFTPDPKVTNVPSGYSDPAMQFAAGGTTMNFTIPAGAATTTLPDNGSVQLGTVAGTTTVTLTQLSENGASVLPQPPPSLSVTLPLLAPVIASGSVTITSLTSTGFNVELDAYSTSRDLASATFSFQAASGTQLNGTTSFSVSLSSVAPGWFSSTSGLSNGGSFHLIVPFTFSGDTSVFGSNSVTVTLTNSVGTSSSVTGGV
jgi:sugar lactone lactonase YvrE